MVASFDKAIPPGQEGKVTLKVFTKNKKGKFRHGATIWSDDPQMPTTKISISGFVKQYLSVEPSTRLRLRGYYGDNIKKKVTITSLDEHPLKITDITSDIEDKIDYKLKTIQKNKKYSLEIKTRSGIKDSFRGKVVLKTNHQKKPEIELSVMGKLKNEVKVAPQYIYFGIIDTNKEAIDPKSLKRKTMISRFKGDNLTIQKIETSRDWITTETETNEKGKKYTVVIRLDKDKLPKGEFRENVTVHTKYNEKYEVANIIIEANVK